MNFDCFVIISTCFLFSIYTLPDTKGSKYHLIFYLFRAHLHLFYKSVQISPVGHDISKIRFSVICIIIYIFTKYYDVLNLWYQNLK